VTKRRRKKPKKEVSRKRGRRHLLKKISWSRFAEKMDELAYG
jgi:hypothetical protein